MELNRKFQDDPKTKKSWKVFHINLAAQFLNYDETLKYGMNQFKRKVYNIRFRFP